MMTTQLLLVSSTACVRLAPRLTSLPTRRLSASPRCSSAGGGEPAPSAAAAPEPVLFPRRTDDGFSYYDDRFITAGGSAAWLQNLQGTLGSRILTRVGEHLAVTTLVACVVAATFGAARSALLPDQLAGIVEASAFPSDFALTTISTTSASAHPPPPLQPPPLPPPPLP